MRNKNNFITSPKQACCYHEDEFVTVIIFEKSCNLRLKTNNFPFIKVHGKAILDKQIEIISSMFKNFEIIFVCGNSCLKIFEHAKKYKNINLRIVQNQNFSSSNCCESIRVALNNTFNNKILILPEDILIPQNSFKNLDLLSNFVFVYDNNNDNNFEIGAIKNDLKLESLTIGIKQNYWTEIFFIGDNKTLKDFREILFQDNFKNKLFFESINFLAKKHDINIVNITQCTKLNNAKILKRINAE